MRVRVEKKGIRALGVAESFTPIPGGKSTLAGVVMRSDLIVDGFAFGQATLEEDDSTQAVIGIYKKLNRNDINVILLGGAIISLYNIIDVDSVAVETSTPVICITFEESQGLEPHLKHHFPDRWEIKLEAYRRLGERKPVTLKTGYRVFVRCSQIDKETSVQVLDKFTLQGAVPEPVRLAGMIAKAKMKADR